MESEEVSKEKKGVLKDVLFKVTRRISTRIRRSSTMEQKKEDSPPPMTPLQNPLSKENSARKKISDLEPTPEHQTSTKKKTSNVSNVEDDKSSVGSRPSSMGYSSSKERRSSRLDGTQFHLGMSDDLTLSPILRNSNLEKNKHASLPNTRATSQLASELRYFNRQSDMVQKAKAGEKPKPKIADPEVLQERRRRSTLTKEFYSAQENRGSNLQETFGSQRGSNLEEAMRRGSNLHPAIINDPELAEHYFGARSSGLGGEKKSRASLTPSEALAVAEMRGAQIGRMYEELEHVDSSPLISRHSNLTLIASSQGSNRSLIASGQSPALNPPVAPRDRRRSGMPDAFAESIIHIDIATLHEADVVDAHAEVITGDPKFEPYRDMLKEGATEQEVAEAMIFFGVDPIEFFGPGFRLAENQPPEVRSSWITKMNDENRKKELLALEQRKRQQEAETARKEAEKREAESRAEQARFKEIQRRLEEEEMRLKQEQAEKQRRSEEEARIAEEIRLKELEKRIAEEEAKMKRDREEKMRTDEEERQKNEREEKLQKEQEEKLRKIQEESKIDDKPQKREESRVQSISRVFQSDQKPPPSPDFKSKQQQFGGAKQTRFPTPSPRNIVATPPPLAQPPKRFDIRPPSDSLASISSKRTLIPESKARENTDPIDMEGSLFKKTKGGHWHARQFTLRGKELSWLKSDHKTVVCILLTPEASIRDVQVGLRKFMFELTFPGTAHPLMLSANGQTEKTEWVRALQTAINGRPSQVESHVMKVTSSSMSLLHSVDIVKPVALPKSNALPVTATSLKSQNGVAEKLRQMQAPKVMCSNCNEVVYKMEEVTIASKILHRRCFTCSQCKRQLTTTNYRVFTDGKLYCVAHYPDFQEEMEAQSNQVSEPQVQQQPITMSSSAAAQLPIPPIPTSRRSSLSKNSTATALAAIIANGPRRNSVTKQSQPTTSAEIDNSIALSKPTIASGRRRAPSIAVRSGSLIPPSSGLESTDLKTSECTFKVKTDKETIWLHASSTFERDKWVSCLCNVVQALELRSLLISAQKTDMMTALNCQSDLENFLSNNQTSYSGYLEKLSIKSQRNWKRRWFELTELGELKYSGDETSKKPKNSMQLSNSTKILSANDASLNGPLNLGTISE